MGHRSSPSKKLDAILRPISEENGQAAMGSYTSWLKKYPSALETFDVMMSQARGKSLVVFLDYDGTLSPIVDDPEKAFMSDKMRQAVKEVAHVFPTAIVSGRCRDKVEAFVKLRNVTYAGSHGMDILTTLGSIKCNRKHQSTALDVKGNEAIYFQPAQDFLPKIQEILKVLKDKIKNFKGGLVEDNKFCISVHFRLVADEEVETLKEMVKSVVEGYPDFRITGGKMVVEIRPCIDWDKGRALQYLIENLGFKDTNDFFTLYIGDDKTDEDAFKVIKSIGSGYGIVVSSTPKDTKASYSLRDTNEVMSFLTHLVKWKRNASPASK